MRLIALGKMKKLKIHLVSKDVISPITASNSGEDALQIRAVLAGLDDRIKGTTVVVIPSSTKDGAVNLTVYGLDNVGEIASTVKVTP